MAPVAAGPLNGGNTTATSVMLDRAENLLHKNFGQYQFWSARRSMRFSPELRKFANEYREKHFNSGEKSKFFKVSHVTLFKMINRTTPTFGVKTGTRLKLNSVMLLVEIIWVSISEEKISFMLEKKKFHLYPMPFLK